MPPLSQPTSAGPSTSAHRSPSSTSLQGTKKEPPMHRLGSYHVGREIGRGSFATVHMAYRSKTQEAVAIKAVSRQKLTAKLLENLESEINILKAINHRNIVGLEDCFKTDTHIYLVMEYCAGSDLSFYIKNRGKLPSLDFVPRPDMFPSMTSHPVDESGKMYWPHPASGGIDERVTRCFLGQLAQALKFLRTQDLIHRDIKPQNLLMQPATATEVADGHPLGIPVLKVADFGFARILPAATMAETLCGSPLYMAPEILRYEKYDARADLWSVGAVLFEMAVGRPPFRASNHVELLRKIERGEDRIKFPDESSRPDPENKDAAPAITPGADIKVLIRQLLKRKPAERMGFPAFFESGVWDGYLSESISSEGESSLSPDVMSVEGSEGFGASERLKRSRDMRRSRERDAEIRLREAIEEKRIRELERDSEMDVEEVSNRPAREKEIPIGSWAGVGTEEERGRGTKEKQMPTGQWGGHHLRQPYTTDPAMNPSPAPAPHPMSPHTAPSASATPQEPPSQVTTRRPSTSSATPAPTQEVKPISTSAQSMAPNPTSSPPARPAYPAPSPPIVRRSEPKYYVSDPAPDTEPTPSPLPRRDSAPLRRETSHPIASPRKLSHLTGTSPVSQPDPPPAHAPHSYPRTRVSEGSPLASTPPITMNSADVSRDESALEGSDSVVGREYVMVEKQTVEVNALADEFDQASRANQALVRRPSTRTSVVSRPVSALRPTISNQSPGTERPPPHSYSPPFAMSSTPPFALSGLPLPPSSIRRPSTTSGLSPNTGIGGPSSLLRTPSSVPQMTVFPPAAIAGYSPDSLTHGQGRYGASPSSLQTGALARALTNTAIRMIGHGANTAATAIARATAKRRPTIHRTGEMDDEEEELLRAVEDVARKAFALFELGDARLAIWNTLSRRDHSAPGGMKESTNSPFANDTDPVRRKSSSSSSHSELIVLRQQELAAGEACVLYCKALGFLVKGTNMIQRYWEVRGGGVPKAGVELNEMVQWLRARFNECYEKADWAKARCADELPFIEKLLHDKARETSRHAALAELQGELATAEVGYETAMWLLMSLLDDAMYDVGGIKDDDRASLEKVINPIRTRLDALRRKMATEVKVNGKA